MKVLKYLWQIPQNILGLLVIFFTSAKKQPEGYWKSNNGFYFGVSLGHYVIFGGSKYYTPDGLSIAHERGHQIQSMYLGPLYLILIGLPSLLGNLWDRFAHKEWTVQERIDWYYDQPWEKWADKLGHVVRIYYKENENG